MASRTAPPSARLAVPFPRGSTYLLHAVMSRTARDASTRANPGLCDRATKEAREAHALAPYALKSSASRGRRWPEPVDPLRTDWERDRDRIVHCSAFRRLLDVGPVVGCRASSWDEPWDRTRQLRSRFRALRFAQGTAMGTIA